jgi:hypothetical protein
LFEKLLRNQVDFLVLGGAAVSLHGFTRMTNDIDIILRNTPANIERFVKVLAQWGGGIGSDLSFDDFQGPGCVRIVEEFPLDVFTTMGGKPFEAFSGQAVNFTLAGGIPVPCLSISDLIELKKGTLREKDELDVSELRRRLRENTPQTAQPTINLVPPEDEEGSSSPA